MLQDPYASFDMALAGSTSAQDRPGGLRKGRGSPLRLQNPLTRLQQKKNFKFGGVAHQKGLTILINQNKL